MAGEECCLEQAVLRSALAVIKCLCLTSCNHALQYDTVHCVRYHMHIKILFCYRPFSLSKVSLLRNMIRPLRTLTERYIDVCSVRVPPSLPLGEALMYIYPVLCCICGYEVLHYYALCYFGSKSKLMVHNACWKSWIQLAQ